MSLDAALPSDVGTKLIAIHRALDAAGVDHAFGGAIALDYAIREPRATRDIDVNVSVPVERARIVLDALPDGVAARDGVLERVVADGQDRLRWGDVPVDLFFPQHEFHAVVAARAAWKPFRDVVFKVVTATDLSVFKAMFNRSKDWSDIEAMLRADAVDVDEALRWVVDILGRDSEGYRRFVETVDRVRADPGPGLPEDGDPNPWKALRRA